MSTQTSTAARPVALRCSGLVKRFTDVTAVNGLDLARYARRLGFRRVAILYENNSYGRGLAEAFQRNFDDHGEVFTDRVSVIVVPSAGLMRWDEDGFIFWVTLPSESKEAYAKLTAGLTPRPARTLPGVGVDAKLPVARVDEVVEPPSAATPAPASDGSNVWIVALGGGVLAALMAGLLLRIRHRRASTPPAAPEAPGAA